VVRKICVHQHNELACALRQPVDVGAAEAHLARAAVEYNLVAIHFLEFPHNILSAIWGVVIDDHDLEVKVAIGVTKQGLTSLPQSALAGRRSAAGFRAPHRWASRLST